MSTFTMYRAHKYVDILNSSPMEDISQGVMAILIGHVFGRQPVAALDGRPRSGLQQGLRDVGLAEE